MLTYPCVLDSILSQADDATLATLLRTCQYIFKLAGRILYREITIKDEVSPPVCSGAAFQSISPLVPNKYKANLARNTKNDLLCHVRKVTFRTHGDHFSGTRRSVKDDELLCLPSLKVWVVIDSIDRFFTPFDWGIQMGHTVSHLAWKGIHGHALTNQLAGARGTARIMGSTNVTLIMDGPAAPPPSADIIDWESQHRSTLPSPMAKITIVAAIPNSKGQVDRHHLQRTYNGDFDLFAVIIASIKCHEVPMEIVGLEYGSGITGAGGCKPWKAWDALLSKARAELEERHEHLLDLTTVAEWLESREARDVYGREELEGMMGVALAQQPPWPESK